jgi:hypothetical protein
MPSFDGVNRETDKHVDSQGPNNRSAKDFIKHSADPKVAEQQHMQLMQEKQQQREVNESHQHQQNDTDRMSQPSKVFGLNFLQDTKDVPAAITGTYDDKEQRWIMQQQEHSNLPSEKISKGPDNHSLKTTFEAYTSGKNGTTDWHTDSK